MGEIKLVQNSINVEAYSRHLVDILQYSVCLVCPGDITHSLIKIAILPAVPKVPLGYWQRHNRQRGRWLQRSE